MAIASNGLNNAAPYKWTYADATARTGDTGFVADDVGKLALQESDHTLWILTATTPTWQPAAGGGTGDMLAANNLSDVANVATARTNLGLGTAAVKNVPASGNAASGEAVLGSDTRLTDSRTPTAHATSHQSGGSDAFTGIVPGSAFAPAGLTGATAASRYVGATASGAPASGTFAVGDFVIDQTAKIWICTTAGTPGTWTQLAGGGGGGSISSGALASRPAAGTAGNLYLPTDAPLAYEDNGSAWQAFGPVAPLTPPALGSFSWVNQGSSTSDTSRDGIYIERSGTGGMGCLVMSAPATPYAISVLVAPNLGLDAGNAEAGLLWRDSAGGKIHAWRFQQISGVYNLFSSTGPDAATGMTANYVPTYATSYSGGNGWAMGTPGVNRWYWLRIEDDGTNHNCYVSADGYHWILLHSKARADYVPSGGNQVGFYVNATGSAKPTGLWVLSWVQS